MINKALFSSNKQDWTTPQDFYEKLDKEFHFTLDPASDDNNHKCNKYFTVKDNGLIQSWQGHTVFCNPPYGREVGLWVKKASEESQKPNTTVVLLIPARTDTKYFHDYIYKKHEIRFIKGRLKFGDGLNPAPFPSMIVVMKGE